MVGPTSDIRLITIPISHYCEKARWGLQRAKLPYREIRHLQLLHMGATIPRGGRSTPMLISGSDVICDSTDIRQWIDARLPEAQRICTDPEALEWEERFDARLGPDGRAWMYHHFLPRTDLLRTYGAPGIPRWQDAMLPVLLPVVSRVIRRIFKLDDARAGRCRDRCLAELDAVAEQLSDGRPYLLGDRFTTADLTFGSLVAPLVLPLGYTVTLPPLELLEGESAEVVTRCRAHPAGQFALRLYAERDPAMLASAGGHA